MNRFMRAFIVLYRAFRSFPLRARIHTLIRFTTSPMLRVVEHVPRGASLLDIGAGHGVFAVLARDRGCRVVGVEPDLRKVLGVRQLAAALDCGGLPPPDAPAQASLRNPGRRQAAALRYVAGYDDVIRGSFDAISIIDVLYKIPTCEWDGLLARAASRLKTGGILIIKEMDPTERWKNRWNRLQERAASALGLTLGESFSYEAPAEFKARLERHGFAVESKRIDQFYPHPHMLYIARLI